ncbi:hypothetical protein ABTE28_20865, partial [Acinetobacter baumannii]
LSIDLSMNLPPQPIEANLDRRIEQGLSTIRTDAGLSAFLRYAVPGGSVGQREAAAGWLQPRLAHASPGRIVIYPGAQ